METYCGWIEIWNTTCRDAAKTALQERHVPHFVEDGRTWWRIEIDAINARHYDEVIDVLSAVREAGVGWNFPLE